MKETTRKQNFEKIENLASALQAVGIKADVDWAAEWYCDDNKVHCGIEIYTDYDGGEEDLSFVFNPDGKLIYDCRQAPLK